MMSNDTTTTNNKNYENHNDPQVLCRPVPPGKSAHFDGTVWRAGGKAVGGCQEGVLAPQLPQQLPPELPPAGSAQLWATRRGRPRSRAAQPSAGSSRPAQRGRGRRAGSESARRKRAAPGGPPPRAKRRLLSRAPRQPWRPRGALDQRNQIEFHRKEARSWLYQHRALQKTKSLKHSF